MYKRQYEQSALARILSLVQEASARKAPTELFIRRFARIYTPLVLFLSALVVIIPAVVEWLAPSFDYVFADWLYRALAVSYTHLFSDLLCKVIAKEPFPSL